MTTEKAFDQMLKIAPHIAAILDDADAADIISEVRETKGNKPAGETMKAIIPLFAGKHREDLYAIVAHLSDMQVEDVREQPIAKTIKSLQTMLLQESIIFFMTCMQMIRSI